jgi:hypothetical protein
MDKVREILLSKGKAVSDALIQERIDEYGLTGAELTDKDAKAIADELESKAQVVSGLATTNGTSKPTSTKGKGKGGRRKNLPTVKDAAKHTANLANQEIQGFIDVVDTELTAWEDDKADQLLARVRNAPKNVVARFVEDAVQEASDVNSFRESAREFSNEFFPVGFTTEA